MLIGTLMVSFYNTLFFINSSKLFGNTGENKNNSRTVMVVGNGKMVGNGILQEVTVAVQELSTG